MVGRLCYYLSCSGWSQEVLALGAVYCGSDVVECELRLLAVADVDLSHFLCDVDVSISVEDRVVEHLDTVVSDEHIGVVHCWSEAARSVHVAGGVGPCNLHDKSWLSDDLIIEINV